MLSVKLNEATGVAILEPDGELSRSDFENAAGIIDPYIKKAGNLNGLIIHVKSFPGWDSFSSLVTHMKFVRDHHKKVARIAFATDSSIASLAEKVGHHFINAEIRKFPYGDLDDARKWIAGEN